MPLAAATAALVAAAAGCGSVSGPEATGPTPDAKQAAKQILATVDAEADAVSAADCGALDFAGTYRCTLTSETVTLVCAVRSGSAGDPYCISEAEDVSERARRAALVEQALAAAGRQGRLAAIVQGMRKGNFTIGCTLGFRTVDDGAAQTDDVVVDLIMVATETGRSFWTTLTVAPDGEIEERTGVDPAEKPPVNAYGGCDLDGAGAATPKPDSRDVALLPSV